MTWPGGGKQDAAGALSLVSQTFVLSVGSGAMADPAAGDVENIDSWLGREQPGRPVPEVSQPEASRESGVWEQHAAQPWRGSWDWNDGWYHSWNHRRPYWGSSYWEYTPAGAEQQQSERDTTAATSQRASGEEQVGSTRQAEAAASPVVEERAETSRPSVDPWTYQDPWSWNSGDWWAGGRGWDWQWSYQHDWSRDSWDWNKPYQSNTKLDYADPPQWPGWTHRRYWVAAVRRWDRSTDIPVHKRAEKVLRVLGWEMQADFEHLSETLLASEQYLSEILHIIDSKAGVREDDDKRRSFRAVMVESQRRKDETLAQYSLRRQRDFNRVRDFGITLPPEFRSMMLKEGAGLNDQNLQNLSALLQGKDDDPDAACGQGSRQDGCPT